MWISTSKECPYCGAKRGFAKATDHTHCFKCGHHLNYDRNSLVRLDQGSEKQTHIWDGKLPSDYQTGSLSGEWIVYITQFLDLEFANKVCGYSSIYNRLIFPIYDNNSTLKCWQGRSLHSEPKWITTSARYPWGNKYPFISSDSERYVIVEDIISAHKVSQVHPTIALLGSSPSNTLCNFLLSKANKFIIWLDNDEAGKEGTKKLLQKMNMCATLEIRNTKYDPKLYSLKRIEEILK